MSAQQIVEAKLLAYRVPFVNPINFNGNTLHERTGAILALTFADGSHGYGDVAPLAGFSKASLDKCNQALHSVLADNIKSKALSYQCLPVAAQFALDCALHQIPIVYKKVASQRLLLGDNHQILSLLAEVPQSGQIKLKLGRQALDDDISLFNQVVEKRSDIKINLDINRQWTLAQANAFAGAIPRTQLDYIEEPCLSYQHSLQFAVASDINIALDESLQAPDFSFKAHPKICMLVIKPTLIGGFTACTSLLEAARKADIQCTLSSSFESSLGIAQLTQLADLWIPNQSCGFDTLSAMTCDIVSSSHSEKPVVNLEQLECLWQLTR